MRGNAAVGEEEEKSVQDEDPADDLGIGAEHLDLIVDEDGGGEGEGGEDQVEKHTLSLVGLAQAEFAAEDLAEHTEKGGNEWEDIAIKDDQHCHERGEVQENVKGKIIGVEVGRAEEPVGDGKMTGAGNRQKLGQALYEAVENGGYYGQGKVSFPIVDSTYINIITDFCENDKRGEKRA